MLVIRPIEQRDFAGLKTCAIESGTGMTSLPVNDELLQRKIDASTQTFLDKPAGKGECLYFFVAEDLETGEMVGTCAIDAAVGLSQACLLYTSRWRGLQNPGDFRADHVCSAGNQPWS